MGLAASQARFLCITARKADCEYKSTELAQQKLEITNQLSDISTEYSNAMNATKLVWSNDAVQGDFGVTYGLLMMPSAANDYNPYMVTTPSGAIVLNSEYAAAAKAAGISKAGGVGSQASRDKFIQALAYGGIVTQETANAITKLDFEVDKDKTLQGNGIVFKSNNVSETVGKSWNPSAGMGAEPLDKSSVSAMTLSDLILSDIGQQKIDWGQMFVAEGKVTALELEKEKKRLTSLVKSANNNEINNDIISQLTRDLNDNEAKKDKVNISDKNQYDAEIARINAESDRIRTLISNAKKIMSGKVEDGYILDDNGNKSSVTTGDIYASIQTQMNTDLSAVVAMSEDSSIQASTGYGNNINIGSNSLSDSIYSVVQNGVVNHYATEISEMTLGDILSGNIVLIANKNVSNGPKADDMNAFREQVLKLFNSLAEALGYSSEKDLTGQGLNVDEASADALKFAYDMVVSQYLSTSNKPADQGDRTNNKAMTENSAYQNAVNYNRIGSDSKGEYYGVSLSNMLAAFLTYYDNGLAKADSDYVVGKSVDTSVYVTDNSGYYYIAQDDPDAVTSIVDKSADFFDELYNNICEYGWREDDAIDDGEYLESMIKDGRYSMSSLNQDGYYYQTRYNETGYITEVSDTDAIARAEAEFTSKKAELTYKEDSIDLKTKQLDAEISSLTTEYDTVKSLISKSIEKTFTLFSN